MVMQQLDEPTMATVEFEIEQMQTYARSEASFALVSPDEENPWKGSRARLSILEKQREQMRIREEGLVLVRKLAHYQTLLGQLQTYSAALVKEKAELDKFEGPHSLLIERWCRAPYIARDLGYGHGFESYRAWFVSNRGWHSRAMEEYEGVNWPPEIKFSESERDTIRKWLGLKVSVEASEANISNSRTALDDHIRVNPELRVLDNKGR